MKRLLPFLALAAVLGACSGSGDASTGPSSEGFGNFNQKSTLPASANVLPGAGNGTVEYQKQRSCPTDEPGASIGTSCSVYSNGNQVSLVMGMTGSKDGESLTATISFVFDMNAMYGKGLVTMEANGPEVRYYVQDHMDDTCEEYKRKMMGATVTCNGSVVSMEGPVNNGATTSQMKEEWKEMCDASCDYF